MHELVCGKVIFSLWKLYFTCATSWSSSGCFFMTVKEQTPVGPLPAWSVAIIVVRKQMWVHTLERKSVCDCGHVCLHGMAVCECLCARVQGVGGWVLESMTWHFLHPVFAPDYGLNAQPCLAILYYSTTHKHTHIGAVVVHVSIHVWLWDDLGQLWSNPESWVGSGYI